ncbi:MAG: hypothetical protein U0W40_17250 [Acidimicrobiia bacterium]
MTSIAAIGGPWGAAGPAATSGAARAHGTGAATRSTWTGASPVVGGHQGAWDRMHTAVASVADLLDTSAVAVSSQLAAGKRLVELAGARGYTKQQVVDTVSQALAANPAPGSAGITPSMYDAIASRIVGTRITD